MLLARALRSRGRRVAIATFDLPGLPDEVDGVEVIRLPAPPPSPAGLARVRWRVRLVAALLRQVDAEVLVQRAPGTATGLIGLLARLRRSLFAYSSASVTDFTFDRATPARRAARFFRLGIRLAGIVVVQTNEQDVLCRRHWGRPGVVIRSIAEPSPERAAMPEGFLWVGRVGPDKRPEEYLRLAARLPEARFWMVGTPSTLDPGGLERIRARAEAVPNLTFLGARPRTELMTLVGRAVAVVNTSAFEGLSNVFLEGWGRGVPALALHHDPDGIIRSHGLGWFADGSVDHLVELAAAAWATRTDQSDFARRCREYVARQHAPEAVAAQWERALGLESER